MANSLFMQAVSVMTETQIILSCIGFTAFVALTAASFAWK